ncbi:MAG: hypothetical protein IKG21_08370 [Atopobiaceae bacterium]|nr:hypothetical protein [Atopobiaceae bacterium]
MSLGSEQSDQDGTTYDDNVNAYLTVGVGGTAMHDENWSATHRPYEQSSDTWGWCCVGDAWTYAQDYQIYNVRPVLGF